MEMYSTLEDSSQDLLSAWCKAAGLTAATPREKPRSVPPFCEYAWAEYDPRRAFDVLEGTPKSYPGHRDILFAGLATWLLRPSNGRMRRQAMLLAALKRLRKAEAVGRRHYPDNAFLADVFGKMTALGSDFYDDFYYPIGGVGAFLECPTRASFVRRLRKRTDEVYTVAALMKVLDFRARCLPADRDWYKLSENMGYKAVCKVHRANQLRGGCGEREAKKRWMANRDRASLIYSARTLACDDNRTLLDLICEGKIFTAPTFDITSGWIRRARFAHHNIVSKLPGVTRTGLVQHFDVEGALEEPEVPQFNQENSSTIRSLSDQKATLAKRSSKAVYKQGASE